MLAPCFRVEEPLGLRGTELSQHSSGVPPAQYRGPFLPCSILWQHRSPRPHIEAAAALSPLERPGLLPANITVPLGFPSPHPGGERLGRVARTH